MNINTSFYTLESIYERLGDFTQLKDLLWNVGSWNVKIKEIDVSDKGEIYIMEKEDKRIIKTKKLIKNVFFELLNEKDFEKISVSEIAERAQISKATFYYHYEDKYDFVNKLLDSLVEDYKNILHDMIKKISIDKSKTLFTFIMKNLLPDYEQIQKIKMKDLDFRRKMTELFAEVIEEEIIQLQDVEISNVNIVKHVLASMCMSFAEQLLEHKEIDTEEKIVVIKKEIEYVYSDIYLRS